jgi:L-ascorbate metabolism protein UlaG (beta-lactamase superfamily)
MADVPIPNPRSPSPGGRRKALPIGQVTKSLLRRYPRYMVESIRAHNAARVARMTGGGGQPSAARSGAGLASTLSPLEALLSFGSHDMAALWLGHATVLMRIGGLTVLTDPVLSDRIGMTLGPMTLGPQRIAPLLAAETHLPPIDVILVSHAHFDHLDKPTLRRLARPQTTVITARQTKRLIPGGFGQVFELDWGQWLDFKGVKFGALRPTHWGARAAVDRRRGYNSYIVEEPGRGPDHRVLFAGDTAMTNAFDHLERVKLAVLGIGAYEPWEHAHATPEQAWSMFRTIGAQHMLPVHHSTFPLGEEGPEEPMRRLLAAAGTESHRIVGQKAGSLWVPGEQGATAAAPGA